MTTKNKPTEQAISFFKGNEEFAFCRRLDTDTVEKIPVKPLLNEERIEVLYPQFLEID